MERVSGWITTVYGDVLQHPSKLLGVIRAIIFVEDGAPFVEFNDPFVEEAVALLLFGFVGDSDAETDGRSVLLLLIQWEVQICCGKGGCWKGGVWFWCSKRKI